MELTPKTKKILAISIIGVLGVLIILATTLNTTSEKSSSSFIVTDTLGVDLSSYQPRVRVDEGGNVKTQIQQASSENDSWGEFLNSEDIPPIPEIPVYIEDKNGNRTLIDSGSGVGSVTTPTNPTSNKKGSPDDDNVTYYKPRGIRADYKNQNPQVKATPTSSPLTPTPTSPTLPQENDKEARRRAISARYSNNSTSPYSIPCVVHTTQLVTSGQILKVRVTKDVNIGGVNIPKNYILSAIMTIASNRAQVKIPSLVINGTYYNLSLTGLGEDGVPGVIINTNEVSSAVDNTVTQEVVSQASNVVSQLGVAGQVLGSIGRAASGAQRQKNSKDIQFLDRQIINFIINE